MLQAQLREALRAGAHLEPKALEDQASGHLYVLEPLSVDDTDLSPREIEVLQGLASGLANKEIALELQISAQTARNHISRIYQKLGVSGRAEAAVQAVRLGLIKQA